jgi:AraC-like DNA-binding protein
MTDAGSLSIVDGALRGAAVALFVLVAVLTIRQDRSSLVARLGATLSLGAAAYVVCSAPDHLGHSSAWFAPVLAMCAGNPVIFWLFTRAAFDDSFRPSPWHGLLCLALVAGPVLHLFGVALAGAAAQIAGVVFRIVPAGMAALALAQTVKDWRGDLVEGRRRMRLFIVVATATYIAVVAAVELTLAGDRASAALNMLNAAGLASMAAVVAALLLRADLAPLFAGANLAAAPPPPSDAPSRDEPVDRALLVELDRLMGAERLYRQEGVTIGALAARLAVPEHKLRRTINRGLGFRNFNEYLNRHRLADARQALNDPAQAGVPILTIALDAGFQSLGPFNRAFKAETGMTPSEFRRAGRAEGA